MAPLLGNLMGAEGAYARLSAAHSGPGVIVPQLSETESDAFLRDTAGILIAAGLLYPFFGIFLSPSDPRCRWHCRRRRS
jgi:hypothetical protein